MKALFLLAATLAAGAQAREPESLAAVVDEMAVFERVLGAALESETSVSTGYRSRLEAIQDQTGINLRPWLQQSVRSIEAEYLAWQGILVSLQLRREPSVNDLPNALFTTMARTGETRLPMILASLESGDFAGLKRLVDELDETRKRQDELRGDWHRELRNASDSGSARQEPSEPIMQEMRAVAARERELDAAIDAEIKRLRDIVEPRQEPSTDDVHAALVQAVCDYAMLKSLPDDEHLTLKVSQETARLPRRGLEWTYYVLAKQDVVQCRQGSIDAEELRQRAFVYSRVRAHD
ncbi:MAG: hypothetical protein OXH09_19060 [Gammaproteobacteria bacterium]|nr:hypothetical protein [Gammaproteobacteria bacterium]